MNMIDFRRTTLTRFTIIFCPFALIMTAALLAPEAQQNIAHARAAYTIWATMAFLIPSLVLFFIPGDSESKMNYWLLCWTSGFLALVAHFYFTIAVNFHGSLREVFATQGLIIATSNFVDLVWWGFDTLLGWLTASQAHWIRLERFGAHLYIPITFFISAVIIKQGFVRELGITMTTLLIISLVVRYYYKYKPSVHQQGSGQRPMPAE
jgi:hypothetical protein